MTTTRQHIEDLDVDMWATLTRRAAVDAIAAAERLGMQPRAESVALAGMTERELVEYRELNGPAKKYLSPVMQLVEADHLRYVAEGRAREAHQGKLDADAAASLARAEAEESSRGATAASERVRAVEAEAARKNVERAAERGAHQEALQQARAQIEQVRADAAAAVAAAQEQVRAAEARADQRTTERTTERAAGEEAVQRVRGELEQVRADAAAEVAAARGQASGEVAAARQAAQSEIAAAQSEVAAAQSEVAAARQAAETEVAAARQAAETEVAAAQSEIAAARQAAETEVAHAHAYAEDVLRWAQAEKARVTSPRLLMMPIAPLEVRARIRSIENALDTLYQIDYVLEVGMAEEVASQFPPDLELTRTLTLTAQEQAKDLSHELANLPARYTDQSQMEAAAGYAKAAADAYRAFLQRIATAAQGLGSRSRSPDAEIVEAVTTMLADLGAQNLY